MNQSKARKTSKASGVPQVTAVDLFCGVGGLTHGLIKAGIQVKAGIDLDLSCKYAYEANNHAEFIGGNVANISGEQIKRIWENGKVKVLVGCAPCQPFSAHTNKIKGKESNSKWNLLSHFSRLIEESSPDIVSMENVPNLANTQVFRNFKNALEEAGYKIEYKVVFCPDYGIPQRRKRLVLLASRFGLIDLIPSTHKKENYKTVKDAIGHLEAVKPGEKSRDNLHFTTKLSDINLKRIKSSVPNGTWNDWSEELKLECHKKITGKSYKSVYGRMSWNEPAPTITTQFYNYGTGRFGHPEQDRPLTIREASLLQTFPSEYKFLEENQDISLHRLGIQIGNAVPVELGQIIGKSILLHLHQQKYV